VLRGIAPMHVLKADTQRTHPTRRRRPRAARLGDETLEPEYRYETHFRAFLSIKMSCCHSLGFLSVR
jgi:hypothetical protein